MIISQTEHLLIRRFDMSDVKAMCRVLCDPEVMFFSDGVKTTREVRKWVEACIDDYAKSEFGLWAAAEKNSKGVIGYCGLMQLPDIDGRMEIEVGFRLLRSCWGKGYATEAGAAVRDYAFDMLTVSRLISLVDPLNIASIRVVEKLGMCYEKDVMLPGYDHPDHLYAVYKENGRKVS